MPYPPDMVNHPPHYRAHPSGVECIQITEHFGFCIGNAIKYLWRADEKGNAIEDLAKAAWYIQREIRRRTPVGENYCPDSSLLNFGAAALSDSTRRDHLGYYTAPEWFADE
jgi:hypothetical protein